MYKSIGGHIKQLRKQQKMTQDQLAKGICTRSYISQIEQENVVPSPEILQLIAERLQVRIEDLMYATASVHWDEAEISAVIDSVIGLMEERAWECASKKFTQLKDAKIPEHLKAKYFWCKGALAEQSSEYDAAEQCYLQSIDYSKQHHDITTEVRSLGSIGTLYCRNGNSKNPADAASFFNKALHLIKEHDGINGFVKISVLVDVGMMYVRLAEYFSAIRYFDEAEQLNHAYHSSYKLDVTYIGLGICYGAIKHYPEAEFYNHESLRINKEKWNDPKLFIAAYNNLGIIYRMTNQPEKAEEHLRLAIDVATKNGFTYELQNSTIELAKVALSQGRLEEARQLCEQITAIGRFDTLAEARFVLAEILMNTNKENEALELLEKALEGFIQKSLKLFLPRTYRMLGDIYFKQKRMEEAAIAYRNSCIYYEARD